MTRKAECDESLLTHTHTHNSLPLCDPLQYRTPEPGSRPEKHASPPSRASDIANNLYANRDFRRMYPKLEVVTQEHLTKLMLAAPNDDGTRSLPAPSSPSSSSESSTAVSSAGSGTTALTAPTDLSAPSAFTDVLAQVHASPSVAYSPTNLPPTPPFRKAHHILKIQKGAIPHDEHAYFPGEFPLASLSLLSASLNRHCG